MMFSVYQARISMEAKDRINAVGWGGDHGAYEMEARIQRDVKFMSGSKAYVPEMSEHYSLVALCEAKNLDQVFEIGNLHTDRMQIVDRMHSVSVGDIIDCHDTGDCFMVDPEGFTKIEFTSH